MAPKKNPGSLLNLKPQLLHLSRILGMLKIEAPLEVSKTGDCWQQGHFPEMVLVIILMNLFNSECKGHFRFQKPIVKITLLRVLFRHLPHGGSEDFTH